MNQQGFTRDEVILNDFATAKARKNRASRGG